MRQLLTYASAGLGFFLSVPLVHAQTAPAPVAAPETVSESVAVVADSDEALKHDMAYFTDTSCRRLKPEVDAAKLSEFKSTILKGVASDLLSGKYDATYRAAEYPAYPSTHELGEKLKIGEGFSRYENITGIYLPAGEHVVFLGDDAGKKISLMLPDLMRKPTKGFAPTKDPRGWGLLGETIPLKPGLNRIPVKISGNAYIHYFDDHAETAPKVAVNFPTGKVNGYFDGTRQTNADWDKLLDNAAGPIMDARGKHIQVAYPVRWFKTYTRGKGVELIGNYDRLLNYHYTLMGLVKYDKVPKNRIMARVNFNYYMFRDGDGVAYLGDKSTMGMVADPARVIAGDPCWGFSHEAGHVLQMRQITWGGMTEVSNNLFSLYTTGKLGNKSRLKEQKSYASARKSLIEANPKKSYLSDGDVFHRLVPFWQLHLYFERNGHPGYYADVMEKLRNSPNAGEGDDSIKNQFEFIKVCCDVGQTDLTEFFEQYGFFWTGEIKLNDYADYHFTITPEMVASTKAYVASKNYKKPVVDPSTMED